MPCGIATACQVGRDNDDRFTGTYAAVGSHHTRMTPEKTLHDPRRSSRIVLFGGSGGEVVGPITSGVSDPSDCSVDVHAQ